MDSMETQRTRLRRFHSGDLQNMISLESDPDVIKFTPARVPQTSEQIDIRLKKTLDKQKEILPLGFWAAEVKTSGDFIGWFMLAQRLHNSPEIGFMIVKKHWGHGFTTEIAQRLIEFGKNKLHFEEFLAVTDEHNMASKRVLQKLGFQFSRQEVRFDSILNKETLVDHFLLRL